MLVREGSKVVLVSDRGVQYSRYIRDVKLASECVEKLGENEDDVAEDELFAGHDSVVLGGGNAENGTENGTNRSEIKPKRVVRKPERYKDMFLYRIYQ